MTTEILKNIPEELLIDDANIDSIAPSLRELNKLAILDNIETRVLIVRDNHMIEACAICYIEERRHHGLNLKLYELFGYHLHDYSRIYAKNESALNSLIQLAEKDAKANHCDIIYWSNIPKELVPSDDWLTTSEMKIFDVSKSSDGWKELYNRKSVKRFRNKASRVAPFRVEVIDGKVSSSLMQELSEFHINRWRFADSGSPFQSNSKRIEEYLVNPGNKHYMRLLIGDELLACHYGMRYGKTLLWHTPIINPKYLALSPLRILLAETALYCERNGFDAIDFGLGDEAYKDGYCNTARITCSYQRTFTLKGELSNTISFLQKKGLKQYISSFKSKVISVRSWLESFEPVIKYLSKKDIPESEIDKRFCHIGQWTDFYDFCLKRNYPLHIWQYERFLHDDTLEFIALADEEQIYSSGWVSSQSPFTIGENGETIELQGRVCLFDFVTPEIHRNKGYYTALLDAATVFYRNAFIYAKKKNIASRKAIERSNFVRVEKI